MDFKGLYLVVVKQDIHVHIHLKLKIKLNTCALS